ncbi:SDR family NAD(P)-dependent oxidoreductase [Streptomyces sp. DSM 44915]|uniref:SDR family NAD(P)-dependent oxidoreductase n=1 Tax=Streptomyces chisholmiae TaxID=3075540 RepID=A0ABU2JMH1_9ACTN|nr:SDR family NAD(P)-dependent oxidoreductase [Streptomyces sp. DSM 44915]MDT0265899.1 SDR family NAD(P)-dependent oxidoreductase [Streptomyces sp. DSM 44915]
MTTFALIGAGPGLGAATARRFGREGFDIALVARSRDRLDALAAELAEDGVRARGFTADVRDPEALTAALDRAAADLGPIEALQYSPVPHPDFMRPIDRTDPRDLRGPLDFSLFGPMTAVSRVLPGMRALGRGTLLFVNGGSAVRPHHERAGTSIAFAAEGAYARMLHDSLAAENIRVAQLIVPGAITPGDAHTDPARLADLLWDLHQRGGEFRYFAAPVDD